MNGRSDRGEFFPQSAFETVLDYATDVGLGRYTFWSVNRDRECVPPNNGSRTLGTCSSVAQQPWDFTRFTTRFASVAPTEPPEVPMPEPCSAPAWDPATTYVGGDEVTHEGHTFRAKWWNRGAEPGGPAVWADLGPCA